MTVQKRHVGEVVDRGSRLVHKGKSIHLRKGSKVFSDSPQYFTHFTEWPAGAYTATGPIGPDGALTYTSTGTAVTNPTLGGLGGVLTLTTDDVQFKAEELATPLAFQIDTNAPLVFETRLKVAGAASSSEATREAFFGFADALTYTSGRPYTVTTASAITGTNVPADFIGFAISGVPTSGAGFNTDIDGSGTDGQNVGFIQSVATVDTYTALKFTVAGVQDAGRFVANAAGTTGAINDVSAYHVYRIEIDIDGYARMFVDGKYCGKSGALTATVPLGAYFDVVSLTGSGANTSATMSIDYVYVGGSSTWNYGG